MNHQKLSRPWTELTMSLVVFNADSIGGPSTVDLQEERTNDIPITVLRTTVYTLGHIDISHYKSRDGIEMIHMFFAIGLNLSYLWLIGPALSLHHWLKVINLVTNLVKEDRSCAAFAEVARMSTCPQHLRYLNVSTPIPTVKPSLLSASIAENT
jgi:hypothetical protein